MLLDRDGYKAARSGSRLDLPDSLAPYVKVCRDNYTRLRKNSSLYDGNGNQRRDILDFEKRVGDKTYRQLRSALALAIKYSKTMFPAYRSLHNLILNHEWLALVDYRHFHRDHVIHQAMSVYVAQSLIQGRDLSDSKKTEEPEPPLTFHGQSLENLAVEHILHSDGCQYLRDQLAELDLNGVMKKTGVARTVWRTIFRNALYVAALYHDIGRPWEFTNLINKSLVKDNFSDAEDPTGRDAEWYLEHYGRRLVMYPFFGYRQRLDHEPVNFVTRAAKTINLCLRETHGLPGAITALYKSDCIRQHPVNGRESPIRRLCLEWAAMAMLMHDLGKVYADYDEDKQQVQVKENHLRLSMDKDPLSFILTLTDQLQDFNRPDFDFRPPPGSRTEPDPGCPRVHAQCSPRCSGVELNPDPAARTLTITYTYCNWQDYLDNKARHLPERQARYFHPTQGYLDISSLGLERVELRARHKSPASPTNRSCIGCDACDTRSGYNQP